MIATVTLSLVLSTLASLDAGPVLGDLTSDSVRVWVRTTEPTHVRIEVQGGGEWGLDRSMQFETTADRDNTTIASITGLSPATRYNYTIDGRRDVNWWFETQPVMSDTCLIAFGSCANEEAGSSAVWKRMLARQISALVLLGDTPYIDTTDLKMQRARYRAFAMVPAFAQLVGHTPVYSTWDDHDFGLNDTDGNLPGKENSRKAFGEYRPNPSIGEAGQGIYTKFRQGPVEVFLLDTRWFARTQGDAEEPTLLGDKQWQWLERSLTASTAPFKVLACGMVFNDAVRPGKTDCWGVYPKEYDRLIDLLARTHTTGAMLVSGDVHWSRVIAHDTKHQLGYTLVECVTSPIHEHLIKAADAPHPGLIFSIGEPNSFLVVEAAKSLDGHVLIAQLVNAKGSVLHEQRVLAIQSNVERDAGR